MKYRAFSFVPPAAVNTSAEYIVYFEGRKEYFIRRFLPSTYMYLILIDGAVLSINPRCKKKEQKKVNHVWFKTLHEWPICCRISSTFRFLAIAFKPYNAFGIFNHSLYDITNAIIDAKDLNLPGITHLYIAFQKAYTADLVQSLTIEILKQYYPLIQTEIPAILSTLDTMQKLKHEAHLPELAANAGISTKHLDYLFDKYVGLSPKKYGGILRFNEVIHTISQESKTDWMALVERFGYFDQAHFIHDFKRYSGLTPTQFHDYYITVDHALIPR